MAKGGLKVGGLPAKRSQYFGDPVQIHQVGHPTQATPTKALAHHMSLLKDDSKKGGHGAHHKGHKPHAHHKKRRRG